MPWPLCCEMVSHDTTYFNGIRYISINILYKRLAIVPNLNISKHGYKYSANVLWITMEFSTLWISDYCIYHTRISTSHSYWLTQSRPYSLACYCQCNYCFKDLAVGKYDHYADCKGYKTLSINDIDTTECVNLGDLPVKRNQTEG